MALQIGRERRSYELTRGEFEAMTAPLMDRTRTLTEEALADERPNFDSWDVKVVVVDNGCVDATSEAVDAATEGTDLPAEVLGCRRRGKGAAVRYGVDR